MTTVRREREALSELLELYTLATLWNIGSGLYKNRNQKRHVWELLAEKLQEILTEATAPVNGRVSK